ncbi:hypothetical protein K2Z83_07870 [Oscillochloris sp. ZM17-4]|uniref:hypothetical protein n=1 Tax=Oscillochloris sp. ZM17-4 TaxID=2866714 RepID=UPI001C7383D1|nr:hypothetical protein [Oscillochloris sp. ZM17-4]MBX0327592.1 hypothetical protein [Oscillochloris sp. ZM17-4]
MDDRHDGLQKLAEHIDRAGLRAPAAILLDLLCPLDVISSQIAQFARPLVRGTGLDPYAGLLAEAASWQELRRLLSRQ